MSTQEPLTDTFYFALTSFLLQSKQNLLSAASDLGLTHAQAFALLLLDTSKPKSMKSYSQAYACDAANLTGIIDGLEAKSLVTRRQDVADRRIKAIHIEPEGITLRAELLKRIADANTELLSILSPEEQKQFARLVEKLANPT